MKLSHVTSSKLVGVALLAGLWAIACSSDSGDNAAAGGSTATGGKAAGGSTGKTGGASSTTKSGGASSVGGTSSVSSTAKTGGASSVGGAATGGASVATGGAGVGGTTTTSTAKTGGAPNVGGAGGATGTHTGGVGVGGVPTTTTGGHTGTGGSTIDSGTTVSDGGPGFAKLSVPLTTANTQTVYDLPLVLASGAARKNLQGATVHVSVCAAGATGGVLQVAASGLSVADASTTAGYFADGSLTQLSALAHCDSGDMTTVNLSLTGATGDLNPAAVDKLSILVSAGTTGPWADPTVLYVESITVTGVSGVGPYDFTSAATVSTSTTNYPAVGLLGLNTFDVNVANSSISFSTTN